MQSNVDNGINVNLINVKVQLPAYYYEWYITIAALQLNLPFVHNLEIFFENTKIVFNPPRQNLIFKLLYSYYYYENILLNYII